MEAWRFGDCELGKGREELSRLPLCGDQQLLLFDIGGLLMEVARHTPKIGLLVVTVIA